MMQIRKQLNAAATDRGFTLVEIMIAIAISGFVLAILYTAFLAQQKLHYINEQVAEMQQNLRGAALLMTREIRMAGFDPTANAGAGIIYAGPGRLMFQQDLNGNGVIDVNNETVAYGFRNEDDPNWLGIPSGGVSGLGRAEFPLQFQQIAENIAAIGFAYAYDANGVTFWGVDDSNPPIGSQFLDTQLVFNGNAVNSVNLAQGIPYDRITAVRIWLLARSRQPDKNFMERNNYIVGGNVITPANLQPGFRHRLLVTTIELRNGS